MSEQRKTYDKEFKLSAVKMIVEEGMSAAQVSRDLGVNENSLHNWKKAYLEDQQNAFPGTCLLNIRQAGRKNKTLRGRIKTAKKRAYESNKGA